MLKHAGVRGRSKPVAFSFAKSGVCVSHFRIRFRSQRSKLAVKNSATCACIVHEDRGEKGRGHESKIGSADSPPSNVSIDVSHASGQRGVLVVEALRRPSRLRLWRDDGIPGRASTTSGRRQCASGLDRRSGRSARGHGGARSSRVSGTAETCQEACRDGDRGTTSRTCGEAETKACSSAGASSSATPGADARTCSGKSGTASGASTGPGPASGTSASTCAYASPGEGSAASAASTSPGSGPGRPATATGSCPQTRHPLRRQRRVAHRS